MRILSKALILIYGLFFILSVTIFQRQPIFAEDAGKLLPTAIKEIRPAAAAVSLEKWVKSANEHHGKLSVAGMQHSQGGHTYYPGATMIDMKSYNRILDYKPDERLITVQSGVTWEQIQRKINPDGLALRVTQSQAIFTVGGSLSANIHGRDIRFGSIYDTVQSLRLLTPTGQIIEVSRTKNTEWLPNVIGGYGLYGIILDVTLKLTSDELYQIETKEMSAEKYPDYFAEQVLRDDAVRMHMARISVGPDTFFNEMYVINYRLAKNQLLLDKHRELHHERIIALPKTLLGFSRYSDKGKELFWQVQKDYMLNKDGDYITRNNVMRSESEFMEYEQAGRTEVLSELFIPVSQFTVFVRDLKAILSKEQFNLLNITIRYVEKDEQATLSYAKEDMFALVLLINQGTGQQEIRETREVVQKMIDAALVHGGSYYLPYYPYASKEQLTKAYPNIDEFFKQKQTIDPNEVFVNLFYKEYK
ncbi:FAD-binding oxidoreductase [Mesobacillus foraminis]|nr:FAD-binding oxidoreductase [Mesobacillus foraminis]